MSPRTKFFVLTNDGKIQSKKAEELIGNYHLEGRYRTELTHSTPKSIFDRILLFDLFEKHSYFLEHSYFWKDNYSILISISFANDILQISPSRAYIVGTFMASGEIEGVRILGKTENILHLKIKGTQGSLSNSQEIKRYLNKLLTLIEENFPKYFDLKIKNSSELIVKDKNHRFINEYLEKIIGTKTNNPVPEVIIQSSLETKLEYLRGFFDAGFYCEERARYNPFWIGKMIDVLNYEEMFFLTTLLMRLGFRMNINYVTTQKSFRIRLNSLYVGNLIRQHNLFKFYDFKKEWVKKYCDYIERKGWEYEIVENLFGRLLGYIVAKTSLPGDNSKPYRKLLGNIILYNRTRLYPEGRAEFIKNINKKLESKISEDFLSNLENGKLKLLNRKDLLFPKRLLT